MVDKTTRIPLQSGSNRKGMRLRLRLAIGAGVVIVLLFCGLGVVTWQAARAVIDGQNKSEALGTSAAFERALENRRLDDAYALTTQQFQRRQGFEGFRKDVDRHHALKAAPSAYWRKDEKLLPHEPCSGEFTFETEVTNDKSTVSYRYTVVKEAGRWRIDSLTFR